MAVAISPHTYYEVIRTNDPHRRKQLTIWFNELWLYWRECLATDNNLPSFIEAENLRVRLMSINELEILPDLSDRVLISDAVCYRCDLFCTRDWSTLLKHRDELKGLEIEIVTPSEWWERIRPYAGLFA